MGCWIRVPGRRLVAFSLPALILLSLLGGGSTVDPLCGLLAADVTFARPTDSRGTVQLAELQDQFETVARQVAACVVAISATTNTVHSDEAVRADSLNGDKLEAILNRSTRTVGTGFFIDSEGYILTNEHVVADAAQIWVTTDDKRVYPAIIVGSDPRCDLAVLKIPARSTPAVRFANPRNIQRGMWTIAIGNPYGLAELGEMSVSVGIVSAVDRSLPKLSSRENRMYTNLIQTTAEINPGNSGGPLFDLDGRVIGINTAVILPQKQTNGIGFALPISEQLLRKVEDLKQGREIVYGYLGVLVSNPTARERRSAGIAQRIGVMIDSIEPDSPAGGHLRPGDIVVRIDGRVVRDSDHFVSLIGELPVNVLTPVELHREGRRVSLELAATKRPLPSVAINRENQRFRWRGMLIGPIPGNWQVEGNRPQRGVMVIGVEANSPALRDGVEAGTIITSIGGRPVTDVVELQRIINELPPELCRIETTRSTDATMASGSE